MPVDASLRNSPRDHMKTTASVEHQHLPGSSSMTDQQQQQQAAMMRHYSKPSVIPTGGVKREIGECYVPQPHDAAIVGGGSQEILDANNLNIVHETNLGNFGQAGVAGGHPSVGKLAKVVATKTGPPSHTIQVETDPGSLPQVVHFSPSIASSVPSSPATITETTTATPVKEKKRSSLNPATLERNRERMRQKRSQMSEEERDLMRQKSRERMRRVREQKRLERELMQQSLYSQLTDISRDTVDSS